MNDVKLKYFLDIPEGTKAGRFFFVDLVGNTNHPGKVMVHKDKASIYVPDGDGNDKLVSNVVLWDSMSSLAMAYEKPPIVRPFMEFLGIEKYLKAGFTPTYNSKGLFLEKEVKRNLGDDETFFIAVDTTGRVAWYTNNFERTSKSKYKLGSENANKLINIAFEY